MKDRQRNDKKEKGQKNKQRSTKHYSEKQNNDPQNTTVKSKDWATTKTRAEIRFSGKKLEIAT